MTQLPANDWREIYDDAYEFDTNVGGIRYELKIVFSPSQSVARIDAVAIQRNADRVGAVGAPVSTPETWRMSEIIARMRKAKAFVCAGQSDAIRQGQLWWANRIEKIRTRIDDAALRTTEMPAIQHHKIGSDS